MKINNDNLMRLLASDVEPKISIILPIIQKLLKLKKTFLTIKTY